MSLVLKSDVVIKAPALSDRHGIAGATDWLYMLDFSNEVYLKQVAGVKNPLADRGIVTTRASSATYVDKDTRQVRTAAANIPRIHFSEKLRRNGLLIETKKINHFLNSDEPKTQNITLLSSTLPVMVWVEGTGSVNVSGAGVSGLVGAGTAASPILFTNTGSVSRTITVTVSGSLSFVQVEYVNAGSAKTTKIHTTSALVQREADTVKVDPVILADSFPGSSGTFLLSVTRYPAIRSYPLIGQSNAIFEVKDSASNDTLAAARVVSSNAAYSVNQDMRIRQFQGGAELPLSFFANDDHNETVAVSWDANTMRITQNGRIATLTRPASFKPDSLAIGGAPEWISGDRRLDGIVNKVVLYNRRLTDKELERVTMG